jgi:ribosomal protein L37AE/L43A
MISVQKGSAKYADAKTTLANVRWWRKKMNRNLETSECKKCSEKLEKKEGDALYYCLKCSEKNM